jgi:hypothetical protein
MEDFDSRKQSWDTQEDKICVDVKLNYEEKVKGAYLEEDAPLPDPESALPSVITRSDTVEGGTKSIRPTQASAHVDGKMEAVNEEGHTER